MKTLFDTTPLVTIQDGRAVTSSLQVAEKFGKEHKHVLRDIRNLDCSKKFKESNFGLSFYISELHNGGQKKQPLFYLTRDGFTFLVMGFTGKLAGKFKEEYINAFNNMEEHIKGEQNIPQSELQNKIYSSDIQHLKRMKKMAEENRDFYFEHLTNQIKISKSAQAEARNLSEQLFHNKERTIQILLSIYHPCLCS